MVRLSAQIQPDQLQAQAPNPNSSLHQDRSSRPSQTGTRTVKSRAHSIHRDSSLMRHQLHLSKQRELLTDQALRLHLLLRHPSVPRQEIGHSPNKPLLLLLSLLTPPWAARVPPQGSIARSLTTHPKGNAHPEATLRTSGFLNNRVRHKLGIIRKIMQTFLPTRRHRNSLRRPRTHHRSNHMHIHSLVRSLRNNHNRLHTRPTLGNSNHLHNKRSPLPL